MEYSCTTYDAVRSECSVHDSGMHYAGDQLIYLDRHHLACPEGKAFTEFRGTSNGWDHVNFRATCCKADANLPTQQPTDHPVAEPTHKPTDHPVAEPTHKPTDHPVAEPTHHPVAEPTHKPTDHPVAEPTHKPSNQPVAKPSKEPTMYPTVNKKPLVCKKRLTKSAEHYEKNLPPGCAIVALDDIAKDDYESTKAVLICGSLELSRADMESAEVIKKGNFKGHSISYFAVGDETKITYYTGSSFDGDSDTFEKGDKPIMEHKLGGEPLNDRIHSIRIETDFFEGGEIPTECPSLEDM